MPVGVATCIATGRRSPSYLISTPTMSETSANISATMNAAFACAAALQAVAMHNHRHPRSIRSLAMTGLGTGTGRVSPELCADLMYTAFKTIEHGIFATFDEAREALEASLGPVNGDHEAAQAFAARAQAIRESGVAAWA